MTGYKSKKAAAHDKLVDDRRAYYEKFDDLYAVYLNGVYDGEKAAQRPWVGLTDDERLIALKFIDPKTARLPEGFKQFAESIEQLLKERNK